MSIGGIRIEILIPESFSLKEKRKILNSLKQKILNNFNASVAEVDDNELWNKSVLDIAIAAKDMYNLNERISKIKDFLMRENSIEVLKINFLPED
ncbi:MAG: DUF503 domain-containing protein [candidate division WOR-3 bacterium]